MKKYLICDLDGTLCDHRHRIYLAWSKKWDEYNSGCVFDSINEEVYDFVKYQWIINNLNVVFLTGRSKSFERETIAWLRKYDFLVNDSQLIMREENDFAPAPLFKKNKLTTLMSTTIECELYYAIDDDEKCCEMYREIGVKNVIHYKG